MLACDFFHVDCAITLRGIYVFFVLEVASRSVHLLGATTNPNGPWTTQQIRNLMTDVGDRLTEFQFLVRDRAGQFTASFDTVLADAGIQVVASLSPRCGRFCTTPAFDPAPPRSGPTWRQFLTAQAKAILAVDFVSVDTIVLRRI